MVKVNNVDEAVHASSSQNVDTLTNNDTGANSHIKFTIGDKSFEKTVNNVATATKAEKSKITWISPTNYTELAKAGLYCVIFRFSPEGDEYSFTVYKPSSGSSAICVVGCQWNQTVGKYLDGYWGVAWLHYSYQSGVGFITKLAVSMVQLDQSTGKITAVKTESNIDYSWIYRIEAY